MMAVFSTQSSCEVLYFRFAKKIGFQGVADNGFILPYYSSQIQNDDENKTNSRQRSITIREHATINEDDGNERLFPNAPTTA
jgi:hypothetical protein